MSQETPDRPYTDIGQRLRAGRKALNLTQTEFAKKGGFTKSQVSNWEGGAHRPSLDACIAMREKFGLSIDYVVFGNLDALPHRIARLLDTSGN